MAHSTEPNYSNVKQRLKGALAGIFLSILSNRICELCGLDLTEDSYTFDAVYDVLGIVRTREDPVDEERERGWNDSFREFTTCRCYECYIAIRA